MILFTFVVVVKRNKMFGLKKIKDNIKWNGFNTRMLEIRVEGLERVREKYEECVECGVLVNRKRATKKEENTEVKIDDESIDMVRDNYFCHQCKGRKK